MTRAVSNRLLTVGNDFIITEHRAFNFRLLLESAPNGSSSTSKNRDNRLGPIRRATSHYG